MGLFSSGRQNPRVTNKRNNKRNIKRNNKRTDGDIGMGLYLIFCGIMKKNDEQKLQQFVKLIPPDIKTDIRKNTNIKMAANNKITYIDFEKKYKNGNNTLGLQELLLKISNENIHLTNRGNLTRLIKETINKIIIKEIHQNEISSFNAFMDNELNVRKGAIREIENFKKLISEDLGIINDYIQGDMGSRHEKSGWFTFTTKKQPNKHNKIGVDNLKILLHDFDDFVTYKISTARNTFTGNAKNIDIFSRNTQAGHWKPFINLEFSPSVRSYMYEKYKKNNKTQYNSIFKNNDQMTIFKKLLSETGDYHKDCRRDGSILGLAVRVRMNYFFDNFSKNTKNSLENLKELYMDLRKLHRGTKIRKKFVYGYLRKKLNDDKFIRVVDILTNGERAERKYETNLGIGYNNNNENNKEYQKILGGMVEFNLQQN